jgi:glucose-1-phosphate cytidylyltransferase
MKVAILAGGLGTRLAEETEVRPKPMVEIGGRPILWHIMKRYSAYGVNDFVIAVGYKGYLIKEYFANYFLHNSDVTFDVAGQRMQVHTNHAEPWRVTVIDTGERTMTGGRIKRLEPFLRDQSDFFLTYGDGLADIDISRLLAFHRAHGKLATVTAVRPPGRFGSLRMNGTSVEQFEEKPLGDGGYINGGFFVLSTACLSYISDDATVWEQEPMAGLVRDQGLEAFVHDGFWQPMDTVRDKTHLEALWQTGNAPWKIW